MSMQRNDGEPLARDELGSARKTIAELETALQSRVVIEQAKGVLGERLGLDVDVAFGIIRKAARRNQTNLHDLATRVVREPVTPELVVSQIAREQSLQGDWLRDHAEAQRRRIEALIEQLRAEQLRIADDSSLN